MEKNIAFRKKGFIKGTVRNYGKYGTYEKQTDGTWKRLRKGYPKFRRTECFRLMKQFLSNTRGYGEGYLETHSAPQLRTLIKSEGLTRQFNKFIKETENGKAVVVQSTDSSIKSEAAV